MITRNIYIISSHGNRNKTKCHHSMKSERHHSVTFRLSFSQLTGKNNLMIIQASFSAIQLSCCHLSVIFTYLYMHLIWYALFHCSLYAFFLIYINVNLTSIQRIMSECKTHIILKIYSNSCSNIKWNNVI